MLNTFCTGIDGIQNTVWCYSMSRQLLSAFDGFVSNRFYFFFGEIWNAGTGYENRRDGQVCRVFSVIGFAVAGDLVLLFDGESERELDRIDKIYRIISITE